MEEIVAEISRLARTRPDINHYSGISVRMSIHNRENLISNAFRRAIRQGEAEVVPRISDLAHLASSMKGKIEWDFADETGEPEKINLLVKDAAGLVFKKYFPREPFAEFLKAFATGDGIEVSEADPSSACAARISDYPQLAEKAAELAEGGSPALLASAAEFILEGLAVSGKIKKEVRETGAAYSSRP
jgi:magnesium chelatase subunit I